MGSLPLAFSVHKFISSVGADAGFAAIIGLAILVLLYFAHARETANLREEAALLAARLQQAEARVAELSRPQRVSAPPAAEKVQVRDQRAAGALAAAGPFAPAGMGAPALAAATHVVPLPEPDSPPEEELAEVEPAVAMAAAPPASASPSATRPASGASPPASPPTSAPSFGAGPSPVPAGAAPVTAMPGPATAAGGNGGGRGAPPAASGGGPAMAPSRAAGTPADFPPRQLPPLGPPASAGGSAARRIVIGLIALVIVAAVAVALVIATNSTSTSSNSSSASRTTNAPVPKRPAAFTPSAVTVAVLNGTATNQLAHHVAAKLAASGYKEGRVTTAANQTETTTVVAYLHGASNRTDALHVASALNLKPSAVQAIDPGTQQVACPPPAACTANVVVTVGADLATL